MNDPTNFSLGKTHSATGDSPSKRTQRRVSPVIVAIGASAGGLEALETFFDNTPEDSGLAFVVVQHLSPDFKSMMDELLARHTKMPIIKVEDGTEPEADRIYLNPAKSNLSFEDGKLRVNAFEEGVSLNLPIDYFFRSLAENAGENAVAVVLSGTGSDGSHGLSAITERGGMVVVQDVESARFDGMPLSAANTGVAHVITSPSRMMEEIIKFADDSQAYRAEWRELGTQDDEDGDSTDIETIFRMFRKKFGVDFAGYRRSTIGRRIQRRIQMSQSEDMQSYVKRLREEPSEVETLYRDLLVEVTEFFRDTQAFQLLRDDVIPRMLRGAEPGATLRVWVPGCATGEEAYSIAMLCDHCAQEQGADVSFRFFATDVHRTSVEFASTGIYSKDSVQKVPEDFRERYFNYRNGLYEVKQALRSRVIFATHNVSAGPPFTRIDLVSCRNMLIYFEPPVQQRVLSLFHFALNVNGFLFLGAAESLGELQSEFDTIDSQWRVFRKLRDVRLTGPSLPVPPPLDSIIDHRSALAPIPSDITANSPTYTPPMPHIAEELLRRYLPPSLVVNQQHELLHTYGDARHLLSPPEGKPTLDVAKLVDGELRMALSAALYKAEDTEEKVVFKGVKTQDSEKVLRLTVDPYEDRSQKLYLVSIEPMQSSADVNGATEEHFDKGNYSGEQISSLRRELEYTRESLQATVEELETSNEELQSTNEELIASNEELQSTNEELQSVNEELYTVNAEHQRKIAELTELTGDMDNLLRSTDIGTIYLDSDLNIRKYTPAVASAFHVLPQDIGRPIEHIANNLDHPDLVADAQRTLETGKPIEREVRTRGGIAYLMRIQPYNNAENNIEGVVLTCVDISALKTSYELIRKEAERQELSDHDLQEFVYAVSHDLSSPLRHITDHVGRIFTTPKGSDGQRRIGNKEEQSLTVLKRSSQRLQDMIQHMLAYSRVVSRGNDMFPTPLERLLEEAINELNLSITESNASISYDPLPELPVDGGQITRLFKAILDNAIRYSDRKPEIQISSKPEPGSGDWTIRIKDNGIGIRPQHLDRIFVMFQRLEFVETPGAGVGLALAKRIVSRHRGKIWAESTLDKGSTFFVRLPSELYQSPDSGGPPEESTDRHQASPGVHPSG